VLVLIVNETDVEPAGTVTDVGTLTSVELSLIAIVRPPDGAADVNVTVPVVLVPPRTEFGLITRLATVGALMLKASVFVTPLYTALTVTFWLDGTATVVIDPEALDSPPGTVILADVAYALLSVTVTVIPAAGATEFRLTVTVEVVPPNTLSGLTTTEVRIGALTTIEPVLSTPLVLAVIVTDRLLTTGEVVIRKLTLASPSGIIAEAGTWPALLLALSVMTCPPAGAVTSSVTVPVVAAPP
jgi:hypothetical protein